MGIEAGAEMTTLEMRFIALRCKDTIAPTGTIAQGVKAKQMNGLGEIYETKYGVATCERVYGTTKENQEGRGPCYLKTEGLSKELEEDLYKAYLNMAPSQTLRWLEGGQGPSEQNVEIEGTEPYIVGGHTASGYWVDNNRQTTIRGLYAAGDVAGGAPQKYVTGAIVEGKIAGESIVRQLSGMKDDSVEQDERIQLVIDKITKDYEGYLENEKGFISIEQLEETMQKIMDTYAGGIGTNYQYNETGLNLAKEKINGLFPILYSLKAKDMDELLQIYEIRERLIVCQSLIEHLLFRKETRWHSFGENMNYPESNPTFDKYVNSYKKEGRIQVVMRDLIVDNKKPLYFHFNEENQLITGGEEA